jgi:hypothetical protein
MTTSEQALMPESVNAQSVAAFFERERASEDRAVSVIRAYADEERHSPDKFNQINADCVEHFLREVEQLRSDLATARADTKEAIEYIAKLRAPLLWFFGTTDPELLAEQWRDAASPEPIRPAGEENA